MYAFPQEDNYQHLLRTSKQKQDYVFPTKYITQRLKTQNFIIPHTQGLSYSFEDLMFN